MQVMHMVRKQLYIEERQERALKRRAKALGISRAEVVRQALDALFATERDPATIPGHLEALNEVLERASKLASVTKPGANNPRYRRDELYQERESRWTRPS